VEDDGWEDLGDEHDLEEACVEEDAAEADVEHVATV